jgi:hypothetical protein
MPRLAETLGTLPSGKVAELSGDNLRTYLVEHYISNDKEKARRAEAAKRLDFYRDQAADYIESDINTLFRNLRVREWRKAMIPFAQFQNITRRVVREISTVYAEPATRRINGANERYQDFQRLTRLDRRMRVVNQRTNLLNNCLIHFRIRGDGAPIIDVITPDRFWALSHPNDPTWFIGAIIEQVPRGQRVTDADPHYLVISDTEYFKLNKHGWPMGETITEHGLGQLPVVLSQRDPPEDQLLDATSGTDLTSAHRAIAILNVLMLKHQKAGTRLAYATGDTSGMARDQPMDEEALIEAPEGVALNTLDMGADPNNYVQAARAVIKQTAANYGIPESVFDLSYQATSGFEIELKRVGLREVRRDQLVDYRPLERELAELQSTVLLANRHPLAFAVKGWSIDFGEVETPQDPIQRLLYWDKYWSLGLVNRTEMYLHDNPEAREIEAEAAIARNDKLRFEHIRRFQQISASPDGDGDGDGQQQQYIAGGGDEDETITDKVTALTALIRAGYEPEAAATALGVPQMKHKGLLPITLKVGDGEDENR